MKLELQLPPPLQSALGARARVHARSVEDEARLLLEIALEPLGPLNEQEQLSVLDEAQLWRVASQKVPLDKSERMQALTEGQKAEGLSPTEMDELERLQRYAQRIMFLRAEAAVLLKRRGHDVSHLLVQP